MGHWTSGVWWSRFYEFCHFGSHSCSQVDRSLMSNPFYVVRRELGMEMGLWGGKVDGVSPGPATFSSVDANGSLFVVYDIIRQEPDADWNGSYIVINPGGTGNSS